VAEETPAEQTEVEDADADGGASTQTEEAGLEAPAEGADETETTEEADSAEDERTATDEAAYGPGSAAVTEDGSAPEGYPIKGNGDSMLFHTPESRWYEQTIAEVWFATEEAAEAAGFSAPGGDHAEDDDAKA